MVFRRTLKMFKNVWLLSDILKFEKIRCRNYLTLDVII